MIFDDFWRLLGFALRLRPDWLVELLLTKDGQPPTDVQKGAFMARPGARKSHRKRFRL